MKLTPDNLAQMREENFIYCTGWSDPMALAGATVTPQIQIGADAPFKCYYITIAVKQGAEGEEVLVLNWAGTISIKDTVVGKDLMNVAIPVQALAGTGEFPYNVPPPRVWAHDSTVIFSVTTNVATRTLVNICLHGSKLFPA
jgi:hypothetical protein